jgi:hypothetical protein
MELSWLPAQPFVEAARSQLAERAARFEQEGITAPLLLGIEEGAPFAVLDVFTATSVWRLLVLAEAAETAPTAYTVLLLDLAEAEKAIDQREIGPEELADTINELLARVPLSDEFLAQEAALAQKAAETEARMVAARESLRNIEGDQAAEMARALDVALTSRSGAGISAVTAAAGALGGPGAAAPVRPVAWVAAVLVGLAAALGVHLGLAGPDPLAAGFSALVGIDVFVTGGWLAGHRPGRARLDG